MCVRVCVVVVMMMILTTLLYYYSTTYHHYYYYTTGITVATTQEFVDSCVQSFYSGVGYYLWTWKVERGLGFDDWDLQYQSRLRSQGDETAFTLHANSNLEFWK